MNSLFVGIIAGAIGMGYFVYGKRQAKFAPMLSGVLLCIYPYFTDSMVWLAVVGLILAVVPFMVDF